MTEPLRVAPEAEDGADNLTKAGAHELAARLDAYWHAKGATHVRHWVEPKQPHASAHSAGLKLWGAARAAIWVVRSNLIRGQPPRRP
jgi:glutamine synthetase type III